MERGKGVEEEARTKKKTKKEPGEDRGGCEGDVR
jgi:hypothetical protein